MPDRIRKHYRLTAAGAALNDLRMNITRSGAVSQDSIQGGIIADARFWGEKLKIGRHGFLDAGPSGAFFTDGRNGRAAAFFEVGGRWGDEKDGQYFGASVGAGATYIYGRRYDEFFVPAGTLSGEFGAGGVGIEVGAIGEFGGIAKINKADPYVALVFGIGKYLGWSG